MKKFGLTAFGIIAMLSIFAYHFYIGEMVPALVWFVLLAFVSLIVVYEKQTNIQLILATGLSTVATLLFLFTLALGSPRKWEWLLFAMGFVLSWLPIALVIPFTIWAARIEWLKRKA